MKLKRWLIGITLTIISVITATCIAFLIITSPSVKIAGWRELDLTKLNAVRNTVTICDAEGNIIADKIYNKNRLYTPIENIPQHTRDAFTSIEDKRFYSHNGIDYIRILGAAKNNIMSFKFKEGASTITQQLIKNTHLTNKKTITRKLQEIKLAKQLEKKFTKDEILETYLNILYFGNNIYGIGRAAQTYFNKSVDELDIAESALLAGIINNPSRFNPYTKSEDAKNRRNTVISRMAESGKITEEDAKNEKEKGIKLASHKKDPYNAYIENVIAEAAENSDCLPEELFEQVDSIKTNINKRIFDAVYSTMSDILLYSGYNVRTLIVDNINSAVICDISNASGTTLLKRQPGSAIKPFISYAPAIEKKLVFPVSVLKDEKTDFDGYSPKNFGNVYYGNVTVADSLKLSLNVPAVQLTDMCGISYSKATASRFGIKFSNDDNGLALALGGMSEGITLHDLADAYATLARGGLYSKSCYACSADSKNKNVYKKRAESSRAIGSDTAFLLTDMLSECAKSGTAKKLNSFNNVAAKTGTVEHGPVNSDAYCIAYTPRYTVAVWYGNDSDKSNIYGGREPAALVKRILPLLGDDTEFPVPDSVEKLDIDAKKLIDEGIVYLAAPSLPKRYTAKAYFSKNNLPKLFSYGTPQLLPDDFSADFDDFEIVESLG